MIVAHAHIFIHVEDVDRLPWHIRHGRKYRNEIDLRITRSNHHTGRTTPVDGSTDHISGALRGGAGQFGFGVEYL
jgi:hypothetical protein